ncbi:hypothetical protein SDC9_92365 [bioreactor metagenome]|uniref:Uncharacterized protein n=1 Tax=bioreactor metagenome TaxID=1076179 RepID=A0A644ZXM0_9ZZZZ
MTGDCLAQRMLRPDLGAGRQLQQRRLIQPRLCAEDPDHLGLPICKRSGFVEGHARHLRQPLQRVSLPNQDAKPGGVADPRHDGGGRSQH